MDHFSDFNLII